LAALLLAPALAQDPGPNAGTDLYDRPVLAVDPGMHTGKIWAQAVDEKGRYAVTGGDDRTVRIWSVADGKLLRTIWIPVGPDPVGAIYTVAISPDGSMIAAGGWTEQSHGQHPIYLFDRESGGVVQRIRGDLPNVVNFLKFSPDGRYLAAMLGRGGLRVFDRDQDWSEAFRDDGYGDSSYGAAFAPDGRLATTSYDGKIRLYAYDRNSKTPNFRAVGQPIPAPGGSPPRGIAFSPDGNHLAVGYHDVASVDVLDARTLKRTGVQSPENVTSPIAGLERVAWSRDGRTLYAAGGVQDAQGRRLLFAWDRGGLGGERRMTYCAADSAAGVDALPDGRIFVTSMAECVGLMEADGKPVWTVDSPVLDFRDQSDVLKASPDGRLVDFGYRGSAGAVLRFDVRSLTLSSPPPNDDATSAPNREGLTIDGWRNGMRPTLNGRAVPIHRYDIARSLAIASDAKRFFLGSTFGLASLDAAGAQKWRCPTRGEVWAVNASPDGRIVVAAEGDGTIRWLRANDGRELLALQVLPNKKDWVLWTPEGFYEATPGAQDVLKWVTNHGADSAASTLPVSAIPKLRRPDALPLVLQELETARALGIADVAAARSAVQTATGSAKPPGGTLHVLAIGLDTFGEKAGGLHLDYAAEDARDAANALLESQKGAPGKPSLYADVSVQYLPNDQAGHTAILDALDAMARSMRTSGPDQDVAVILVSSHGEMIDGQFYLIPYGFDAGSPNASTTSALSASEFAKKVKTLAEHGKVLLLLDACHSGAVGAGGWASDPDAKVLQDAMDMENVTVLTSSKKSELSQELPVWRHGAFTQAFLDALAGGADPEGHGVISMTELASAMGRDLATLTHDKQHLGPHVNFLGDLFVVSR
jgi:WD40 repeat protein